MGVISAAVRHLIAAGVSGDDLVRAIEDIEAAMPAKTDEQAERRRAKDRVRKQQDRLRISAESAESADKEVSPLPPLLPPSLSPAPQTLPPISPQTPLPEPRAASEFDDFWKAYPKQTAIGTAKAAFANAIQFQAADPALIVRAAKAYRAKAAADGTEDRFIPAPAKWLDSQSYLDPALDRPEPKPVDLSALEEWKRPIAERLGKGFVGAWLDGAVRDGPKLHVANQLARNFLTERYAIDLKKFGITEILLAPTTTETP